MPWYRFDGTRHPGGSTTRILVTDINGDSRQVAKNQTVELSTGRYDKLNVNNIMTAVANDEGHPAPLIGEPSLPAPNQNVWPQVRQFKDWTLEVPMNEDQMYHGQVKIATIKLPSPRFMVGIMGFAVGTVDAENATLANLAVAAVPEGVTWEDASDPNSGIPLVGAGLQQDVEAAPAESIGVCSTGLMRLNQSNVFGPCVVPNAGHDGIDATEPPEKVDVYLAGSAGFDYDAIYTLDWLEIVVF